MGRGVGVGVEEELVGGGGEWGQGSRMPVVSVAALGSEWVGGPHIGKEGWDGEWRVYLGNF